MNCTECESDNVKVVDSRMTNSGKRKRRYLCNSCGERFTTYEYTLEELKQYGINPKRR